MAGDWIKMQVCLPDKPEVWQMAARLSTEPECVVGRLLRVWGWFDSHTENGNAVGVSFSLLDRVAGVTGFAEAMYLCGWLEQKDTTLVLPNFDRHNGKSAKNRALTSERVAKFRNGTSVTRALPEKRREEKKKNIGADALTVDDLVVAGLTEQTAGEFISHRKSKGAKLTARAWQGVVKEAEKAGWPVEQAVCKALSRGWTGFEAAWVAVDRKDMADKFAGAK